jgi:hypothetical protein
LELTLSTIGTLKKAPQVSAVFADKCSQITASAQIHSDGPVRHARPRFPGESRDPLLPWALAFAGEAVLSEMLHRRVNRVNDSEH